MRNYIKLSSINALTCFLFEPLIIAQQHLRTKAEAGEEEWMICDYSNETPKPASPWRSTCQNMIPWDNGAKAQREKKQPLQVCVMFYVNLEFRAIPLY